MRKTVFLHIGAPSGGARFLQRRLDENGAALRDAGIAVLDVSRGATSEGPTAGERPTRRRGFAGSLRGSLAGDCPTVVVSGEHLARAPAHRVGRVLGLLADHHVKVIYGMPDLGAALVAEWQRDVLATTRMVSLAAWIKELASGEHRSFWRSYGLSDVFGRWTVPAGDVHVIVEPSDPSSGGELWRRFASVIDAPATVADVDSPLDGPLALEELELLRRVQGQTRGRRLSGLVTEILTSEIRTEREPRQWLRLPQDHRAWVDRQAALQQVALDSSGFHVVGSTLALALDDRRFDIEEAIPDGQRMIASGVEISAALVERLICIREGRGQPEGPTHGTGGGSSSKTREAVQRTRGLASKLRAAATGSRRERSAGSGRRTYYVHIGAPKSGSSYLQRLLWKNRDVLNRNGVYVPGRSQKDHFWAGTDFRGRQYVTQAPADPWRGAWDRLIDDAERSGCPKIVITSEFLADAPADRIAAGLERLRDSDVHVVYAVRDLAGLLGSVWQQGVQVGAAAPWPEWLDGLAQRRGPEWMWLRHDVGEVCARWAADVVDNIDVLVLPRPGSAPDEIWRRFQSIVGWSVPTRVDVQRANESLGYSQAEFLRLLQHRLVDVGPRHQRARITKNVIASQVLRKMERVDALLVPEHLRGWLETESAQRRDQLVASDVRIVGDPDDLLAAASRLSPAPPDPCASVMTDAAVKVIERLAAIIAREDAASVASG